MTLTTPSLGVVFTQRLWPTYVPHLKTSFAYFTDKKEPTHAGASEVIQRHRQCYAPLPISLPHCLRPYLVPSPIYRYCYCYVFTCVYFGTRVKVNILELHQDLRRRKLASPVYHVAQVAQSFPQNTGSWQTDRRTDRHRAIAYTALCMSIAYASCAKYQFAREIWKRNPCL